jgi:hypothetical protein
MAVSSPVPTAQDLQGLIFPLQLALNGKLDQTRAFEVYFPQ